MRLLKRSNSRSETPPALATSAANRSQFVAEVPVEQLIAFDALAEPVDVATGESLVDEDSLGRYCYFVLDGFFDVIRDGDVVADVAPGWFAGEMSIRNLKRRNAKVVARVDSKVYRLVRGDFDTVLATCPAIAEFVDQTMQVRHQ